MGDALAQSREEPRCRRQRQPTGLQDVHQIVAGALDPLRGVLGRITDDVQREAGDREQVQPPGVHQVPAQLLPALLIQRTDVAQPGGDGVVDGLAHMSGNVARQQVGFRLAFGGVLDLRDRGGAHFDASGQLGRVHGQPEFALERGVTRLGIERPEIGQPHQAFPRTAHGAFDSASARPLQHPRNLALLGGGGLGGHGVGDVLGQFLGLHRCEVGAGGQFLGQGGSSGVSHTEVLVNQLTQRRLAFDQVSGGGGAQRLGIGLQVFLKRVNAFALGRDAGRDRPRCLGIGGLQFAQQTGNQLLVGGWQQFAAGLVDLALGEHFPACGAEILELIPSKHLAQIRDAAALCLGIIDQP